MAGALAGVRVVDFGQYIAGPLAAMLLADQGADVVRVEMPGGPRLDTPANQVWNRGKRSIALDLGVDTDREIARRLIETADVVIENFRPGVMGRFGLGASDALAAAPRLIYCSLPGFASDDPRRGMPGWDGLVFAATATIGRSHRSPDGEAGASSYRPVFSAIPAPSSFAAFIGVVSIAMALNARERDGVGQVIEVPLHDSMFTALGYRVQKVHGAAGRGDLPDDIRGAMGTMRFGRVSVAGAHQCKDGRWVYVHSGNKNIVDFVRATGADEWDEGDVAEKVKQLFLTRTAREWEDLGAEVETEVIECRSTHEWMHGAHARGSSMVVEVDDPIYGPMLQPGLQVRMSSTLGAIRPAPASDADRAEVLAELASRPRPSETPPVPDAAAVLAGKKVLDLCIVLAGPTCGRTLAEFGADVIKIERPPRAVRQTSRATPPGRAHAFNIDINRGKKSIMIDLKTERGLDVFWKLAEDADVIVQNFRLGIAEKLGFGYEQVRARRPDIIYASLNMYGYDGPWAGRPGHEQIGQHGTGMAVRYGDNEPILQDAGALNDYGTGLMGAYGVALALYHRERTGEGQHVTTSLAHTGQLLQSPYFYDYVGRGAWDEPGGQGALGFGPLQRLYATSDGWAFLAGANSQRAALATVRGLEDFPVDSDAEGVATAFLEERLALEPADVWAKRLSDIDVGIHALVRLDDLMQDPWVRSHNLVVSMEHEHLGTTVDQSGPPARLSRTPVRVGNPAPPAGADGRAILSAYGLHADELSEAGAVVLP